MAAGAAVLATVAAPAYGQARPLLPPHPTRDHLPYVESDCPSGDPVCIAQTIAEMYRRINSVVPVCDHRAAFSLAYLRVTEEWQRRLAAGFFEDEAWTGYIDRVFAGLYFNAYDAYAAGRRDLVPPAWELAFETARRGETSALGNFILEFNAHVNRDLPFAIARVGTAAPDGTSHKPDYDRGNAIVTGLAEPVLDELVERFDPTTDDLAVFPVDQLVLQMFLGWRERTWRNAELLLAAPTPSVRAEVAAQIERQAVNEGQLMLESLRYRGSSGAPARDAWCALHGGQQPAAYEPGAATLRLPRRPVAVRGGRAPVTIACPEPSLGCSGTLAITQGRRTLGRRRYQLVAGELATVRVPVRRAIRGRATVRLTRAGPGLSDLSGPIRLSAGAPRRGRS
jgi:hypothetical protein